MYSGLRPEYIKLGWHMQSKLGEQFRTALVGAVEASISGRISGEALSQSTLALIPKPDGALRPIGIGEVLRRIVGRIVMMVAAPSLASDLQRQSQLLLAQHGAAIAYRKVRMAAASGMWVLQLDLRNAFNEVSRAAVLECAPDEPILIPLVDSLYGAPSTMRVPRTSSSFLVTRGVVQGCPLGSLLFATALMPAVHRAASGLDVNHVWYADDGHISAASPDTLAVFFDRFTDECRAIGLTINTDKSRILRPSMDPLPPALRSLRDTHEITALGGPVFGNAHQHAQQAAEDAWTDLLNRAKAAVAPIGNLEDPQYAVRLLASSGVWSRVRYHAMCRGRLPDPIALDMENVDQSVLCKMLPPSAAGAPLSKGSWLRATIPKACGGLGIQSTIFESGVMADLGVQMLDALASGDRRASSTAAERLLTARTAAVARRVKDATPASAEYDALLMNDLGAGKGTALLSVNVRPSDGTLLGPVMARAWLALMIGAQFVDTNLRCPNPKCKNTSIGVTGHHAILCPRVGASRHNRARDTLILALRRALPRSSVVVEQGVGTDGVPTAAEGGVRPIDFGYLDNGS